MHVRRSSFFIVLIGLLVLLAGGLAGALRRGPAGAHIAFQHIASGNFGGSPDQPPMPWLAIIVSDNDMNRTEHLIPSVRSALPPIDYTQSLLVIVFRGWSPTSGYDIRVDQVRATATTIAILATATEPGPTDIVQLAVTSPYEIITIARPPDLRGPIAFQLLLNGSRQPGFEVIKTIE